MKYVITEGMDEDSLIKAGKARVDVVKIANKLGYKTVKISAKNGVRQKKWQKPIQFLIYRNNSKKWDKALSDIKDGSALLLQYPLLYTSWNFREVINKHKNRLEFISVIHDLDSIRFKNDKTKSDAFFERVNSDDREVLNSAKKVISHNKKMTSELVSMGVEKKKIIELEVFDYLDDKDQKAVVSRNKNVIIAGNLDLEKSNYLSKLKTIKGADFNLYGINFNDICKGKNIHYQGAFKPDELVKNLEGSFGLIWDGDSIKTCSGLYGEYMRFNNPHKTSLYLSAGLPVIIWKEAALADFIEKNKVGFSVSSLEELPEKLKKITKKDYENMVKNTEKIAKKLKKGDFLANALKKAEK